MKACGGCGERWRHKLNCPIRPYEIFEKGVKQPPNPPPPPTSQPFPPQPPNTQRTPRMKWPIDVTGTGPLYHSERLRNLEVSLNAPEEAAFVEQCADLLEQYRVALLDIYVLGSVYAQPKQSGSPLEQVTWIALHRGLGRDLS